MHIFTCIDTGCIAEATSKAETFQELVQVKQFVKVSKVMSHFILDKKLPIWFSLAFKVDSTTFFCSAGTLNFPNSDNINGTKNTLKLSLVLST